MSAAPRFLPLGSLLVYSPLGLSFVDDLTGEAEVGSLAANLAIETPAGSGVYVPSGVVGLFTNSGTLVYPNLERRGRVPSPAPPPRNYRVAIGAQYYTPLYPSPQGISAPGFAFTVPPYDSNTDFTTVQPTTATIPLLPNSNYPFAATTPLLRGNVVLTGAPVVALVTAVEPYDDSGDTNQTRVATDQGGSFLIPLRWGNAAKPTTVTATVPVSGKSATVSITFPYNLTNALTITIS